MPADVRRVLPEQWQHARALRLEALQDTPTAYCERYVDAVAEPDAAWQARVRRGAAGGDSFQVLAWADDAAVASCVGFLDRGDAVLAAVYVAPAWRGGDLLAQMVAQVVTWAREQQAPRLRLLVHESNARAARAYARLGFLPTGHREPYPLDPTTDEVELALPL